MAIFRVEKNNNYTVMSNVHLRDAGLTLKAKGLLSLMLSLPEAWDYTLSGLAAICREGVDAIRTAVQELEQAGYISRRRTQDESGKFAGNEYIIHESPQPSLENPTMEEIAPSLENPMMEEAAPLLDFPLLDNPSLENPTELNKDRSSKDLKKKNKRKSGAKALPDWKPERFQKFWDFYRIHCRGENKQGAIRAWDRLRPDDKLIDAMGLALRQQLKSPDWQKGVGIPYASTWLNNARWEDEKPAAPAEEPPRKEAYF